MLRKIVFFVMSVKGFIFAGAPVVREAPYLLSYVEKNLPHAGVLKQTQEGFLYIELPKEYVFDLLPLLDEKKILPPPYFEEGRIGAHISVATEEEIAGLNFPNVPHLEEEIPFSVVNLSQVKIENSWIGTEVYVLKIDAPKIGEIRQALGLPEKINERDWHITVGVR